VLGRLGAMVAAAATSDGDFVARLDQLSALITDYLVDEPHAARLLFREVMDRGPFLEGPNGSLFEQVLATAVAFLAAGHAAGAFDVPDPGQAILSIMGLHLAYFAVHELTERVQEAPVFSPESHRTRRREVVVQVRRLCGVSSHV